MRAENVHGTAGLDAQPGAKLVRRERNVTGSDFRLREALSQIPETALIQRHRFQHLEALAKRFQFLRNLLTDIQVRVLSKLLQPIFARQLKCPGFEQCLARFE